jgi:D-3-phosphoglycerate dehydrogenase
MHTIISGIEMLSEETSNVLSSIATYEYQDIMTNDGLINALQSCDIFWFRLNHKLTREVLEYSKCQYILCAATGLDHIDIQYCEERGIKVLSLKGEFEFLKEVRATAEHTLGLVLALIRKIQTASFHVENGEWDRTLFQGQELYKKSVGILGFGRLGKIMADYYNALGMKVYYYDSLEQNDNNYDAVDSIETLFKLSDVLSIHLPYNDKTHTIINKDLLKQAKPNVIIVNTSRGGVVDEKALLIALENKQISGYATDVLYGEPDIKNHPLVTYAKQNENIIVTPHIGGNTIESVEKTELFIANKLKAQLNK